MIEMSSRRLNVHRRDLLGAQNFDIIRFSTYRTACKLRFIQKKLNCKFPLTLISQIKESDLLGTSICYQSGKIRTDVRPRPVHRSRNVFITVEDTVESVRQLMKRKNSSNRKPL